MIFENHKSVFTTFMDNSIYVPRLAEQEVLKLASYSPAEDLKAEKNHHCAHRRFFQKKEDIKILGIDQLEQVYQR